MPILEGDRGHFTKRTVGCAEDIFKYRDFTHVDSFRAWKNMDEERI